jgi:hypothetical protein
MNSDPELSMPDEESYGFLYAIGVDLDWDAQLAAIESLLARNQEADSELTDRIAAIAEQTKSLDGRRAEFAVDQWVDSLHHSTYQDGCHSLAAVGMIAPFIESALRQSFNAVQRKFLSDRVPSHKRFQAVSKKSWDCRHYIDEAGKWKQGIVLGTQQLSDAIGLSAHIPKTTNRTLSALFEYRNKNFHHGLEWPMAERLLFVAAIKDNGWSDWFTMSETAHQPKIIYMSTEFTQHCLRFCRELLGGFGNFVFASVRAGDIDMNPPGPVPEWLSDKD